MLFKIILLLTVIPLVELLILVRISELTSFSFTVLLVIVTGVIGGILARVEGLRVVQNIRQEMEYGRLPADGLLDGAMVLAAGALLLTPGILTDALGFVLLFPPSRKLMRGSIKRKLRKMGESGSVRIHSDMGFGPINTTPPPDAPPMEDDNDNKDRE